MATSRYQERPGLPPLLTNQPDPSQLHPDEQALLDSGASFSDEIDESYKPAPAAAKAPASARPAIPTTPSGKEVHPDEQALLDRGGRFFDPKKGDRLSGMSLEETQDQEMGKVSRPGLTGVLRDVASGFARGMVRTAPQQVMGVIGGAGDILERAGRPELGATLKTFAEEQTAANQAMFGGVKALAHSEEEMSPDGSFLRKAAVSGAENLPFSLATAGPLGVGGAMAGRAVAGVVGLKRAAQIGGAVGGALGGTAFGLSEYWGALKEGLDAGLDLPSARAMAQKSGAIEGIGETLAGAVLGGVIGRAMKPWKDAAAAAVKSGDASLTRFLTPTMRQNLIQAATVQGTESGTEFLQEFGEAKVREQAGVPTENPLYAGSLGAASAVFMGGLFGLGAVQMQRQERERLLADLNNMKDPHARLGAVAQISKGLGEYDEKMANLWGAAAMTNVMRGEPVPVDSKIISLPMDQLERIGRDAITPSDEEMPGIREQAASQLKDLEDEKMQSGVLPPHLEAQRMWLKAAVGDDELLRRQYTRPAAAQPGQTIDMATGAPVRQPGETVKRGPADLTAPARFQPSVQANPLRPGQRPVRPGLPVSGEGVIASGQGQGQGLLTQEGAPGAAPGGATPPGAFAPPPLPPRPATRASAPAAAGSQPAPGAAKTMSGPKVAPPAPPPVPGRRPSIAPIPSTSPVAVKAREQATAAPYNPGARPAPPPVPSARPTIATAVDAAAHQAATSPLNDLQQPTEGQKEAGTYKKGHDATTFPGLDLSIENPQGSERSGTRPDGSRWSTTLQSHYGYIKGVKGAEGDGLDVFVKPGVAEGHEGPVFIVNQASPGTGHFDEHKVMLGYGSAAEAREAYLANYEEGWQGLKSMVEMTMEQFKEWKDKPGARTSEAKAPRPALPVEKKAERKNTGGPRIPVRAPEGRKPQRPVQRPTIAPQEETVNAEEVTAQEEREAPAATATEDRPAAPVAADAGANADAAGQENAAGDDVGGKSRVERELEAASLEELDALVESGGREAPKTAPATTAGPRGGKKLAFGPEKQPAGLTSLLGKAAKEVGAGAEEALRGLWELAGGPGSGTATSGGIAGLDRESYDKAKPHFQKAWEHWKSAGKSLQEFVKFIVDNIPGVKLQLRGFLYEQKTGEDPVIAQETAEASAEEPIAEEPAPVTAEAPAEEEEAAAPEAPEVSDEDLEVPEAPENTGAGSRRTRKGKKADSAPEPTNTFEDKGEVWDPYRRKLDADAKDATETSVKKVIAQAARSRVFAFTPQEGATPGVARYAASIRDEFFTFQEYYVRKVMGRWSSRGLEDAILYSVKQWSDEAERTTSMNRLKDEAAKYMAFGAAVAKALNAKNVSEARANIKELLWKDTLGVGVRDFHDTYRRVGNPEYQTEFLQANRERIDGPLSSLYQTVQSANHEHNENDVQVGLKPFNRTFRKEIIRVGLEDYRKGADISSTDAFDAPFEFKGVAFGTWVEQRERQRVVNGAYDAFHDLASVMGIDTRKIPFTHRMQIQFGNVGTLNSRAAALYVPSADVINLSKTSGDGALAHEWGHALDRHIKAHPEQTTDVRAAFADLYNRLSYVLDYAAGESFVKNLFGSADYYRRYMRQGSETALETIKRVALKGYEKAVKQDSEFQKNAESGPKAQYYSKGEEMWARAFEAWVYDMLKERGGENSYLVDEFSSDGFLSKENGYRAAIYPAGEERRQFNEYFSAFTKALRWNEDGTIGISPEYKLIQEQDLAKIIEQRDALLARIEELYNEQFPAIKSEDGLYWYAYKAFSRAKTMQPDGYFAYDDAHDEGEDGDGKGAVGYPAPLSLDQMLDHELKAIKHEKNDSTVYLKEGETADEERVAGPGGVALEDDAAEDVENTGGERVPGERSGERSEPGDEGLSDTFEERDERGSGAGNRAPEVGVPPERGGAAEPEPGPDAVQPAASNYVIADAAAFSRPRTVAERFADNVAAIRTLKKIESEERLPTAEEKDVLALYSGWGGLGEALKEYGYNYSWNSKRELISKILTEEERRGLLESSDVAYYTPADIYAAAYKALEHMGFKGGKVLGPALGVGREFGTLPAHLRGPGTTLMGIEPEPFSYRISKLLYGEAGMQNVVLEKAHLPLNYYDLAISNVPFRAVAPFDKKYNKEKFQLHDYFFRRALAHVRPGGMVAFITSVGTMDKEASLFRDTLAKEGGEFVSAFRLPAIHDQANALADMIFIRKAVPGASIESPAWQKTKSWSAPGGQTVNVNEFFVDHPAHVLGDASVAHDRWGDLAMSVALRQGESPAQLIEDLIPTLPADIMNQAAVEEEIKAEDLLPAPGEIRNRTYFVKDGALFYNEDGSSVPQADKMKSKELEIVKALVEIKDQVWQLFRAETNGDHETRVEAEREILNAKYDAFVKEHGTIDSRIDLMADDEEVSLLTELEQVDESSGAVSKADIFSKRTLGKYEIPTHADSVDDALSYSLSYQGRVDLGYIQRLTGMSPETILEQLAGKIFDDPASGITTADDYLSGNVKEKLQQAEAAAKVDKKYQPNVDALKSVQPADIPITDIYMPLGSPVIPTRAIEDFLDTHLGLDDHGLKALVTHSEKLNAWTIRFTSGKSRYSWKRATDTEVLRRVKSMVERSSYQKFGVKHKDGHAIQLVKWMLNNIPIVLKTRVPDGQGGYKLQVDDKMTQLANDKAAELQAAWERHWKTSDGAAGLARLYNDTNNTEVLYKADGKHLALPGKSAHITMGAHQLNAIWRYIVKGNLYAAHEVGTGKTFVMAAIAMEARRLKLKRKPVLLADGPAKVRELQRHFLQLYPLARLLVVNVGKNAQEQQKSLARVRTGDYDCVIMTKESFGRVPLSPERESVFLQRQVDEMLQYESTLDKSDEKYASELAKQIASIKARIEKLMKQKVGADLDAIYFDDLGIDLILADEAHAFKNVPFTTRLTRRDSKIRGINPAPSGRATDFYAKAQFMNETYPRGLVMASGTPLTNSIAELFNISRLLQPQELERRGITHFDAWVSMFGQIKSVPEFAPDSSGWRQVQKIAKFLNLPELKKMTRQVIDYVSAEDAGVKRPSVRGGAPENVDIAQNPDVVSYQKVLLKRSLQYQKDPNGAEWGGTRDNMLRIVADGKKAAIDMRLIDASYNEQAESKVTQAAARIIEEYNATAADKGVQLIFADLGVPGWSDTRERKLSQDDLDAMEPEARQAYEQNQFSVSNTGWNLYDGMAEKLVSMGIPRHEIEFIQTGMKFSGVKREAWLKKTYQAVRDGKIRIFMGSTSTMGTGINVQDRVTAMHHMDIWWNYAGWVQRNGRGWRRGNVTADKYGGVKIINYGVKGTSDGFVWDKVFSKAKIIGSVESDNLSLREVEDISDETMTAMEAAALFSGDQTYLELSKVEEELRKLTFRESAFHEDRRKAESDLQRLPEKIAAAGRGAERARADHATLEPINSVMFDDDPTVYLFEKHGKLIAAKLEEAWKSKPVQNQLSIGVSNKHHVATLGTAVEKAPEPAPEPAAPAAEGAPAKPAEKPKKTYEFNGVPVRVYFRKFTYGTSGMADGVVLGLSGKLSAEMEKKFTEGKPPSALSGLQTYKKGELGFEEAVAGKMGEIKERQSIKGEVTMVIVDREAAGAAIVNPIVGNLSRTVTLAKSDLEAKAEQFEKERAGLEKSKAELDEVLARVFPETEKILDLRERKARLEQMQRENAAQNATGGKAAARQNPDQDEEDDEDRASFAAPAGWESIEGGGRVATAGRPVNYKTGPDSREISALKSSLLSDPRFKGDRELEARIQAIQEVQAPADDDAVLSEQIRKIMGPEAKVVFVDSAGLFREAHHSGGIGVGHVVYVDIRSQQALSSLVAHGLWHADQSRHKGVLIDVLRKTVDQKKFQALAKEFRAVPHYAGMSDAQLWEEFGARFLEGQVAQPGFWQGLAQRSRVVYLRMARWVINTLTKLGVKVGGHPPVWGEYFSHPEKMAEAVRAAQSYFLAKLGDLGVGAPQPAAARMSGTRAQARFSSPHAFAHAPLYTPGAEHPLAGAETNPMAPPGVADGATAEEVTHAIRKDPTWGKVFVHVPDRDLTSFMRTAALPWWIAKTDPQGRKVMNVQLARDDERNEMFVALTRSQAGGHLSEHAVNELEALISSKGGLEKITPEDVVAFASNDQTELHKFFGWKTTKPETRRKLAAAMLRRGQIHEFLDLSFKEAEALGKVIVESDAFVERDETGKIVKAGKVFSIDELKERGFNEKQVTAYYAWKNGMDAAWETKLAYARASIFWPYAGKAWMNWTERTGPAAYKGIPISDLERVADGAMTTAQAREKIRQAAEAGGFDANAAFKEFSRALGRVKQPFEKIKKYREQWGKVKFYMPRFREQGPIVLRVPGEGEGSKDRFYKRYENIPGTSLSRQAKADYDRLVEEYGYDSVEFYRSPVVPENVYGDISEAALEKFIGRSIGRLQQEGDITEEEAEALTESLFQELANDLNVRGFGQRSMPRAPGEATKGYKEDHLQEIYRDYMSGMAGFLTKRKAAMEFHRALSDLRPKKDEKTGKPAGQQRWNAFDYWRRYAEDMLRNQDRGDELSAKVRSLAFVYFISGNLKGAVVNLTQSFVSTIPVGATITKGAEAKVLKSMRDVAFGRLSPRERKALQEGHDSGVTTAQYVEDVMERSTSGGRDRIFSKIGNALSLPFRKAEIFNRKAAFLFAYRVYAGQGKGHQEAMAGAKDFVNDTQYMFGKANLPEWARSGTGAGKILRTSYTFRSYSHNYINAMAHYMSKDPAAGKDAREFRVLVRSLAYLAVLGGAGAGLPFLDDLLDLLERQTGIQWRGQVRHYLASTFGPAAEMFWVGGLPAMFGADISGSLKIGLPSVSSPEDTLYGVYGGMITKGEQAIQMAGSRQYLRAAETMLPSFASNPLRAAREATQGARTAKGGTKFDERGKPLKLTGGEAIARAAGFRPVRDTLSTQEAREYANLKEFYTNQREKIYAEFRASAPEERAEIRKAAQAYNRSVLKFRGAIPRIDVGDLPKMLHPRPAKGFVKFQQLQ